MKSFLLNNNHIIDTQLVPKTDVILSTPLIPLPVFGYDPEVNQLRNIIDTIPLETWKRVRWYINPYDYIVEDPLINRAFYKFWEIIKSFNLIDNQIGIKNALCLAEAPGGFIQGIQHFYEQNNKLTNVVSEDGFVTKQKKLKVPKIVTMSLNKNYKKYVNYNLPSYNSKIVTKNVQIEYGEDKTGDMTNLENFDNLYNKYDKVSFDLITADGGFDEGNDFNNKEQLHYVLFLTEIYYALTFQSPNGNFVLKMFDLYTKPSVDMVWLLLNSYKEVYICKPKTSRPTNSEKYIVCKGFILDSSKKESILQQLRYIISVLKESNNKYAYFSLFETVSPDFINQIRYINQDICYFQCYNLRYAINLSYDKQFYAFFENNKNLLLEERKQFYKKWKLEYNLQTEDKV